MGKNEIILERLQDELLQLVPAEHKGRALTLLKECDHQSKLSITNDMMKAYKSSVKFIKSKNNL